jgi:hypothetical protein
MIQNTLLGMGSQEGGFPHREALIPPGKIDDLHWTFTKWQIGSTVEYREEGSQIMLAKPFL